MSISQITLPPGPSASVGTGNSGMRADLAGAAGIASKLVASVLGFFAKAIRERRVRRTVGELARLDDHILRDLGISRSEIHYVARYGRPGEVESVRRMFALGPGRHS